MFDSCRLHHTPNCAASVSGHLETVLGLFQTPYRSQLHIARNGFRRMCHHDDLCACRYPSLFAAVGLCSAFSVSFLAVVLRFVLCATPPFSLPTLFLVSPPFEVSRSRISLSQRNALLFSASTPLLHTPFRAMIPCLIFKLRPLCPW